MTRRIAAILIGLAAVVGLLDPFACRWYSMKSHAPVNAVLADRLPQRPLPKPARTHLLDTAKRALALLPVPSGYLLDRASVEAEADEKAIWDSARSAFGTPGTARAERACEPSVARDPDGTPPTLEQRVFVNTEVTMPAGLASVGGSPRPFDVRGGVAVEVTTITGSEGSESGAGEGRVALPLTPAQERTAITVIRVLLANSKTEKLFRTGIMEGAMPAWFPPTPKKPGEIQTLVIEIYGGRADVEATAKRLPIPELRQLLD